jgi:glycosyltransferase involved in cell wall biosynthesis
MNNYLVLSTQDKLRRTAPLWNGLAQIATVTIRKFGGEGNPTLSALAAELVDHQYDRVIFDANIRRAGKEIFSLRNIPRLVLYEYDFCQNYQPESDYYHLYKVILKQLGEHRIIVSGAAIADDLTKEGFCASFVPKFYNCDKVYCMNQARDFEIAFVGRTKHKVYKKRRELLRKIVDQLGAQLIRTEEGKEYNEALNRIRFFISADIGLNEFMIKNFEAMAAGCVLCAYLASEKDAYELGFEDMENVVFYKSIEELADKLHLLRTEPDLARNIAENGRKLAEQRHSWKTRIESISEILKEPLHRPPLMTIKDQLLNLKLRVILAL